jgi:hypothetical protein
MTRTGKIARLPRLLRDELNRRLDDGEAHTLLAAWLNARDDVRAVLATHFADREITEQNLSEWKQGGFEDWCRHQDARAWIRTLVDKSEGLKEDTGQIPVSDWLSAPLAVALGRCIHQIATEAPTSLDQRRGLIALAREVANLRRSDHQAEALRLQRERAQPATPSAKTD